VAIIDPATTESPGTVIGPYKLIEQIGEGGMGSVWMAQQTEPVKRLVAVKLIKAGMDSRQVIARFEAERQALALMDHANIARVLDAGTTGAGRPYFVMDLVKGVPITRYCDEHRLTPRQRLELFIPVCQAIQHAHQKGIIHRDLKPSNVLVAPYDGKPVVKVIDFGVAKAAGQQLTDRTLVTGFGAVVGTLEYMSPEQAELNNHDIDTRSDIYALGVLLYELLAGSPPFSRKELTQAGMLEMLRVIREQEPSKPSTKLSTAEGLPTLAANRGTEPAKLTKLVRGELDWIVMKALEKDRGRRYETANGFAMDVQRYLADEPVLACPPSAGYRLRKFARRNKGRLAVAALVLFFLVALGSGAGWTIRDRAERDRAVQEKVIAILGEADELHKQGKWQEAIAAAEQANVALTSGAGGAMRTRVDNLLKELHLLEQLAGICMRWADGLDHESGDRRYLRLFADFGIDVDRQSPAEVAARIGHYPNSVVWLAAALDEWAVLRRDYGLRRRQEAVVWQRLLEAARLVDPDPWRKKLRQLMGREDSNALRQLADSADMTALPPQSLRLLGQALAFSGDQPGLIAWLRKAHRRYPGDLLLSFDLCFHLRNVPSPPWAEVLQFAEAALAAKPDSPGMHNFVAFCLRKLNRQEEAIAAYARAIELDPKDAAAWINRGEALKDQGDLAGGIAAYREAIRRDPQSARAHANLGDALRAKGDLERAEAAYREAIKVNPNDAHAHHVLGNALRDQGRVDEAIAEFHQLWELERGGGPPAALTQLLAGQGRLEELRATWQKILASNPVDHGTWFGYAELCLFLGRTEEYRQARSALLARFGATTDPQIAERTGRACLLLPAEGEELRRALALADLAAAADSKHPAYPYFQLAKGLAEYRRARAEQAIPLLREATWRTGRMVPRVVLAMAQYRCGHAEEARQSLAAVFAPHDWNEVRADYANPEPINHWIYHIVRREADELIVPHLAAFLNGQYQPQDNEERFELIRASLFRKQYRAAARLYLDYFAAEPKQADDLKAGHRYDAARAAVLAGCGRGQDTAKLDDQERARWRRQALAWLSADLEVQGRRLDKQPDRVAANVAREFQHWLADPGFMGVREPKLLAKLSPDEQHEWGCLWRKVAECSARATRELAQAELLTQARSYIRLSQWANAAAEYAKVDWSRPLSEDAFVYACLFLIRGDSEAYNHFCQDIIQRVAESKDTSEAFVLARSCAMARKSPVDPARIVQWAHQAVADNPNPWRVHALGLAHYRAGQFDQALQSFTKANVKAWVHQDLNWFGLALVHHRLGHADEAWQCLDKGIQWLERQGPPSPERPAKLNPQDWLEAHLLRREAEGLLRTKRSP